MGQLIACVILSGRTMAPLGQITNLLGRMNHALSAYRGLNAVLSGETDEEHRKDMVERAVFKGDVDLRHVTFTYENQQEPALNDISLSLKAGERLAILGRIGCGKTTLLRLICGLYPPQTGIVMIDNADIRQIRADDVRRNVGVVLQTPVLFSGTIRDNLMMGNPDASDEDLLQAAKLSGADAFIGQLPGGFDFTLSERGQELSVGMRQTIAIARALIGKPNVLIMDEPTAALDSNTERLMVDKLNSATKGITTIFVTHRGAMVGMADKVALMDNGRLIMFGPRDEVMAKLQEGVRK